MKFIKLMLPFMLFGLVGCTSEKQLKDQVTKILKENPEILLKTIEENPAEFMLTVQKAAKNAQGAMAKKRENEEKTKFEASLEKPLVPVIRKDEAIRGTRGGPIVLVEYSDFQCPFCVRGFKTVQQVMKKYEGKVQFIYKHLPLSFHSEAMVAAQYYEAARIQSEEKAFQFHDELFANQRLIKKGESFLKKVAKKIGLNMTKLAIDVHSDAVKKRIAEDQAEAAKFGMQGTPGFLVNGVPVKGAYPADHFVMIINKLKEKGKLKL